MSVSSQTNPTSIGVVIVTYNSSDVIGDCLTSLQNSDYRNLKIVLVDNCSPDNTRECIRNHNRDHKTFREVSEEQCTQCKHPDLTDITLISSPINAGFAGGVNMGLKFLRDHSDAELFWVLNPDVMVNTDTATQYAERAKQVGEFGLMGGRILYVSPPDIIQTDGGRVNPRTGICSSIHAGRESSITGFPDETDFDFISGASMVASRQFIETVGFMSEEYFLYYEEVDWAFRRGHLKLVQAPKAIVKHHGGTSIGSSVIGRKQGTGLSNFFNYRNRIWFVREYYPANLFTAYLYSGLKVAWLIMQGYLEEAHGAARGLLGLSPPAKVRQKLSKEAGRIAFGD